MTKTITVRLTADAYERLVSAASLALQTPTGYVTALVVEHAKTLPRGDDL